MGVKRKKTADDSRVIVAKDVSPEFCYPLRESGNLVREFVKVGKTDEELIAFVNRYGDMFAHRQTTVSEFRRMQKHVAAFLSRVNRVKTEEVESASMDKNEGRVSQPRRGGNSDFEKLRSWFNAEGGAQFMFRPVIEQKWAPGAFLSSLRVKFEPTSLCAAIGLLLAYEASGRVETVPCKVCGKLFTRGRPFAEFRSDREVCGNPDCTIERATVHTRGKRAAEKPELAPRRCLHCGKTFQPKRESTWHCGARKCITQVSRWRTAGKLDDVIAAQSAAAKPAKAKKGKR